MFDYETALEQLAHRTVLCIGDLMLDEFAARGNYPAHSAPVESAEVGAPDAIPTELIDEVVVRLMKFTRDDLEGEYARDLIRLVLSYRVKQSSHHTLS